jgi:hypothetical protein
VPVGVVSSFETFPDPFFMAWKPLTFIQKHFTK